jgi:hypothetical protein
MAIEQPTYKVLSTKSGIEVRDYDDYWIAECRVDNVADLGMASSRAFRYLFNYISGDNSVSQKIAMTSPVQQMPSKSGWLVSFVVPKDVSRGDIPVPSSSLIDIRKVDGGKYAALRYSGLWNATKFSEKSAELLKACDALGLKVTGVVSSAVYNPPFMPAFLRRNEVLVRLEA